MSVDNTSLKAVTIGPDATAGSMRKRAKKNGENVPKTVAIKQAPSRPRLTVTTTAKGLLPAS